jgi:ssDNA-binding Zn-finger/Zn-ribbon topoisomerase 1
LEAIESSKYGWFWECPNGPQCKYRHALPVGFVLKKKETEEERKEREAREKANEITIEEFLEREVF